MMERISKIFPSEPGLRTAKKYVQGLLSPIERKNGWQMAEVVGETTPYVMQQFLYRGQFSADDLRNELRGYVSEKLGDEDGVLVVDETGFLKQGKMSCGVKRQYSGTAGRIENCQIGVFLTYASEKGHAPIDRRLYIPEDWFSDPERCRKAGIPETVVFQTKPRMALEMIQRWLLPIVAARGHALPACRFSRILLCQYEQGPTLFSPPKFFLFDRKMAVNEKGPPAKGGPQTYKKPGILQCSAKCFYDVLCGYRRVLGFAPHHTSAFFMLRSLLITSTMSSISFCCSGVQSSRYMFVLFDSPKI